MPGNRSSHATHLSVTFFKPESTQKYLTIPTTLKGDDKCNFLQFAVRKRSEIVTDYLYQLVFHKQKKRGFQLNREH